MQKMIVSTLLLAAGFAAGCRPFAADCAADDPSCNPLYALFYLQIFGSTNLRIVTFTPNGRDATPGTADDGIGPDGVWLTDDDRPLQYAHITATDRPTFFPPSRFAFGAALSTVSFSVGPDLAVWTGDDTKINATSYSFRGPALLNSFLNVSAGTDGVFGTPDDVYSLTKYDHESKRQISSNNPGPDGAWETADDIPTGYVDYVIEADTIQKAVTYNAFGADTQWFTSDDTISGCEVRQFSDGKMRNINYSPGADLKCFTSDDTITSYQDYFVDALGRLTGQTSYGAGTDGVFLTADDITQSRSEYEYGVDGNVQRLVSRNAANTILSYSIYTRLLSLPSN